MYGAGAVRPRMTAIESLNNRQSFVEVMSISIYLSHEEFRMRLIKTPDEARRLARTILSDILLYNQAKVKEGIEKDCLFEILTEEIAEGKKYYESMVDEGIRRDSNMFNEAVVDVLIKQAGKIKSDIW